jgi:hypothetical protein
MGRRKSSPQTFGGADFALSKAHMAVRWQGSTYDRSPSALDLQGWKLWVGHHGKGIGSVLSGLPYRRIKMTVGEKKDGVLASNLTRQLALMNRFSQALMEEKVCNSKNEIKNNTNKIKIENFPNEMQANTFYIF